MRRYLLPMFLIPFLLIATALLAAPKMVDKWIVNMWSLDYQYAVQYDTLHFKGFPPSDSHPRSIYGQARVALDVGDERTALRLLEPLIAEDDLFALQYAAIAHQAMGIYSVDIWAKTGNIAALKSVAETAAQAGELNEASDAYYALWKLNPISGTGPLAGFLSNQIGDLSAAEEVYKQALQDHVLVRERPYWWRGLAELLEKQGRWAEAAAAHEHVIEEAHLFYPSEENLHRRYADLAWAYYQSGQLSKALKAVEQALILDSTTYQVFILDRAGQIYESAGEYTKALSAYQQVLAINPDHEHARESLERLSRKQQSGTGE